MINYIIEEPPNPSTLSEFCEYARMALVDEYVKAKERYDSNAVVATRYRETHNARDVDVVHVYEADVDFEVDQAPPIQAGTPIRVRWEGQGIEINGKLLDWDPLNNKAYLSFSRPLENSQLNRLSTIMHTTSELISCLQKNLKKIEQLRDSICWPILSNLHTRNTKMADLANETGLDTSQMKAVKKSLLGTLSLIWGPPGTGKTYTIGRLIWELITAGKRVLATSISNIAVDNMAIKFIQEMSKYPKFYSEYNLGRFLRFGYTKNAELDKSQYSHLFYLNAEKERLHGKIRRTRSQLRKTQNTDMDTKANLTATLGSLEKQRMELARTRIDSALAVFTTAAQVYTNAVFEDMHSYDVVVIDEASMVNVPIFATLAERSHSQVVAVGDFRQLAPIAESEARYLNQSIFEWLRPLGQGDDSIMDMLYVQRRMDPSISSWISGKFYDNKLIDEKSVMDYRLNLPSSLPSKFVFWDLKKSKYNNPDYETQLSKAHSRYNRRSATCVSELARCLLHCNPELSIAIITPYRAQTAVIRSKIDCMQSDLMQSVLVGTVHAFQGSEADIVIWDLVDTSERLYGLPFEGDNGSRLINVAISRAKRLMIVVGDQSSYNSIDTKKTAPELSSLLSDAHSCHEIIDEWLKDYINTWSF